MNLIDAKFSSRAALGRTRQAILLLALIPWCSSFSKAADTPSAAEYHGEKGLLLRRSLAKKTWQLPVDKEALHNGDLLVGLPGAVVNSKNSAVKLVFRADLDGKSPFPVIESAVAVHDAAKVDLDVTLDRGGVELVNMKQSGSAKVRLRVRHETFELTLAEPGATVVLELYGRWARGVPFVREPDPKHAPAADLVFVVVKGDMTLSHGDHSHLMSAPPGLAMIEWDSVNGLDGTPQKVEKIPAWATEIAEESDIVKRKKELLERFRQASVNKSLSEAIDDFLASDSPFDRRLAVLAMGATDDLARLGKALREAKHQDVWDNGVIALRHWIGRAPGHDQILFKRLVSVGKYSPVQAETVMQLLHSYGEDDLGRPETYQMLIDYLDHKQLAIRGLAYWHLHRLVPAGEKLGYSASDTEETRGAAVQKWRELMPPGQVPQKKTAAAKE